MKKINFNANEQGIKKCCYATSSFDSCVVFLEAIQQFNLAAQLDEKVSSTSEDEAVFAPDMTYLKCSQ